MNPFQSRKSDTRKIMPRIPRPQRVGTTCLKAKPSRLVEGQAAFDFFVVR